MGYNDEVLRLQWQGAQTLRERAVRVGGALGTAYLRWAYEQLDTRAAEASTELEQEVNLPATLLVGEKPQLFAEVDRLRAEGELRLAVVPPLYALCILLAVEQSAYWLIAVVPIVLLLLQGIQREADSRKIIADSIAHGEVPSSSLSKFRAWIEALPDAIESEWRLQVGPAEAEVDAAAGTAQARASSPD